MFLSTMSSFGFAVTVLAYLGCIGLTVTAIIKIILKADKELEERYGD